MSMNNNNFKMEYLQLQEKYLKTRNPKVLGEMMLLSESVIDSLIITYAVRHRIVIPEQKIDDIKQEVYYRLIERYTRRPDWRIVKNPVGTLYFEVLKIVTQSQDKSARAQRKDDSMLSLEDLREVYDETIPL